MSFKICKWSEIKNEFKESTLLIGNGASIALDSKFSYTSLKKYAEFNGGFHEDVLELFKAFDTDDFELILRLVWHAAIINDKLKVNDQKTKRAYENVRLALINTVRNIHPKYYDIDSSLPYLYEFTKYFKTIISLNYDLIVYWIVMYGNSQRDGHRFKDCFVNEGMKFRRDWNSLRDRYWETRNTLIFYPHGNLCLAQDIYGSEFKIRGYDSNLLDSILYEWGTETSIPLFISEGTKEKKMKSIEMSSYLSIIFNEVLPNILMQGKPEYYKDDQNLVIYGWSLGEHDEHILSQILSPLGKSGRADSTNCETNKLAISLYKPNQMKCFEIIKKIEKILGCEPKFKIYFFDSTDAGCWNNPK